MSRYVIQVEREARRVLYGPVASLQEGRAVAEKFLKEDETVRTLVSPIYDPPWPNLPLVNPNQTTLQDHIDSIADAHL